MMFSDHDPDIYEEMQLDKMRRITNKTKRAAISSPAELPESNLDEVALCKGCGTMKHLNAEGLCGRCKPPEDLRAALAEVIKRAKGVKINSGEGWGGFTYLTDGKQDIDDILRICEAAALAALPEKLKLSEYKLNMGVETNPPSNTTRTNLERRGFNTAIATAQANIHSVFGGTTNE